MFRLIIEHTLIDNKLLRIRCSAVCDGVTFASLFSRFGKAFETMSQNLLTEAFHIF